MFSFFSRLKKGKVKSRGLYFRTCTVPSPTLEFVCLLIVFTRLTRPRLLLLSESIIQTGGGRRPFSVGGTKSQRGNFSVLMYSLKGRRNYEILSLSCYNDLPSVASPTCVLPVVLHHPFYGLAPSLQRNFPVDDGLGWSTGV